MNKNVFCPTASPPLIARISSTRPWWEPYLKKKRIFLNITFQVLTAAAKSRFHHPSYLCKSIRFEIVLVHVSEFKTRWYYYCWIFNTYYVCVNLNKAYVCECIPYWTIKIIVYQIIKANTRCESRFNENEPACCVNQYYTINVRTMEGHCSLF